MSPDTRRALRQLIDQIDLGEQMRRRSVQEAVADALACTHRRRAEALEGALPRPDDYPGGRVDWETGEPLDPPPARGEAVQELRSAALACRQKAALLERRWIDA